MALEIDKKIVEIDKEIFEKHNILRIQTFIILLYFLFISVFNDACLNIGPVNKIEFALT